MAIDLIDAAGNQYNIAGRGRIGPRGKPGPAGPKSDTGDDGNPIGTIIQFLGLAAPEGYLVCDGSTHSISDYPYLSAFIAAQFGSASHFGGDGETTFAVPDMRNLFLRGYHGDAEEQLSGDVGQRQEGTKFPTISCNGLGPNIGFFLGNEDRIDIPQYYDQVSAGEGFVHAALSDITNDVDIRPPTYTSRPVNMAVLYCIKAAKTVPSAPVIQVVGSNPNLLRNWYFPNPVNQRGQNVYTGTGYTIDQWRVEGNLKVTLESGWLKLENETDESYFFVQYAEPSLLKELAGSTITHSALCKGVGTQIDIYFGYASDSSYTGLNLAQVPTDGGVCVPRFTTSVPDVVDLERFETFVVHLYPHSTLYIKAAKLELGPAQTLAHQDEYGAWILNDPPPDYGAELAKCQRYLLVIPNSGSAHVGIGQGFTYSATNLIIDIPTPVTMRGPCSCTVTGTYVIRGAGSIFQFNAANRTYYVNKPAANMVTIDIGGFTNLPIHRAVNLTTDNDPSAKIIFSCEL